MHRSQPLSFADSLQSKRVRYAVEGEVKSEHLGRARGAPLTCRPTNRPPLAGTSADQPRVKSREFLQPVQRDAV
jgi:hypothetical protein